MPVAAVFVASAGRRSRDWPRFGCKRAIGAASALIVPTSATPQSAKLKLASPTMSRAARPSRMAFARKGRDRMQQAPRTNLYFKTATKYFLPGDRTKAPWESSSTCEGILSGPTSWSATHRFDLTRLNGWSTPSPALKPPRGSR